MKYLKFKIPSEEGKESTKTSALEKILVGDYEVPEV